MKKVLSLIISVILVFSVCTPAVYAAEEKALNIDYGKISHSLSDITYGINLDDYYGMISSELVCNNSFESGEAYWQFSNVDPVLSTSDPLNASNPTYETLTVSGKGTVKNLGFTEVFGKGSAEYDEKSALKADMGFKEGVDYDFSCYLKNIDFDGTINVYLDSKGNSSNIIQLSTSSLSNSVWSEISTTLHAQAGEDGALAIEFNGTGSIALDFVSLVPQSSFGYGDSEWQHATIRDDVYNAIKCLNPKFIQFSGDDICGGVDLDKLPSWKNTIGEPEVRRQTTSNHHGFECNISNSMGYHEYFQLCEELGAKAVPTLNAGILCQEESDYEYYRIAYNSLYLDEDWESYCESLGYPARDKERYEEFTKKIQSLNIKSEEDFIKYFDKIALKPNTDKFTNYAQDALDLIEYATGDARTTYWGALRSLNGHEQPFNLEYIAIGTDENKDSVYFRNFEAFKKIISEKYPNIKVIATTAEFNADESLHDSLKKSDIDKSTVYRNLFTLDDESIYYDAFDYYDENEYEIYAGRYCYDDKSAKALAKNNMWAAVSEAVFMNKFERNGNVAKMAAYGNTMSKINASQGEPSLMGIDSQGIALTPSYYTQLLYANNIGKEFIDVPIISKDNKVYQSATIDRDKQVVYIKLVNYGSKDRISINLSGFDKINRVSALSLSDTSKSAYNDISKQCVAPIETDVEASDNSFEYTLDAYSVNVIRVAYGDNNGDSLYQLPDTLDYTTKSYIPTGMIAVAVVVVLAVVAGSVIGFFLYTRVISKKNKSRKKRS